MTLKVGQIIKDEEGDERKVLAIVGEVAFISSFDNHEDGGWFATEAGLRGVGYTWEEPAWEPEVGETYYFINSKGTIGVATWGTKHCVSRQQFLGIYPTKEAAEATLAEIKRKLGKTV